MVSFEIFFIYKYIFLLKNLFRSIIPPKKPNTYFFFLFSPPSDPDSRQWALLAGPAGRRQVTFTPEGDISTEEEEEDGDGVSAQGGASTQIRTIRKFLLHPSANYHQVILVLFPKKPHYIF